MVPWVKSDAARMDSALEQGENGSYFTAMMPRTQHTVLLGRPRQFDIEHAVIDAMNVFWTRGYHATSLTDLLEGTGLSKSSLYNVFGNKKSLFLRALDYYAEVGLEELGETLAAPGSVKEAIRSALTIYVPLSAGITGQRGCMVVATAAEMLPHDPEVGARIKDTFRRIQALLASAVRRGQTKGEIALDQEAQDAARFLVCQIEGMRLLGKVGATSQEMAAVVALALRSLE